jgi:two-component system NtrC family response regulator
MRNTTIANPVLLLVEDDADLREQMKWALASEYTVLEAKDRRTAIALLRRETPRLVVLDLGLPPAPDAASEGLAALQEIIQFDPTTKVIVATGNSDRAVALNAVQSGAYDFIEKPVQLDVLRVILQRAAYLSRLEQENRALQEQATTKGFSELLGESPSMQLIFEMIRRVAASDVPVLITGESGTGKELVARSIHRHSSRKAGPFIAINCGAIPENLLESELFGYEKGAFTGAHRQQKGKVEYAHGGTLLLDEIGEMPLGLQVKLLRFLQDGQVERVGGRELIMVDTRILAATNLDIKEAIERGRFRTDLYYRLSVIEIPVPPLRERDEDVLRLAQSFVPRFSDEVKQRVRGFSDAALDAIQAHSWPGNVRELENRIKRAVLMAAGRTIEPADLDLPGVGPRPRPVTLREARAKTEKELVQHALASHNWNVSRAAEELGISRQSLHELIQRYGLQKSSLTEQEPGPAIVEDAPSFPSPLSEGRGSG